MNNNLNNDLLRIEEAILKNGPLMTALCSKWVGRSEKIGTDVFNLASTIYLHNQALLNSSNTKTDIDELV